MQASSTPGKDHAAAVPSWGFDPLFAAATAVAATADAAADDAIAVAMSVGFDVAAVLHVVLIAACCS